MDDAHRQDHRIRKNTQLFWHWSAVTFKLPVKGSGSPSKTWNTKTSQNKHCPRKRLQSKSLSVCLKHSVEARLVTCVAFQYAPSSVYSSMSFTPNLHCAFRSLPNIQSSFQSSSSSSSSGDCFEKTYSKTYSKHIQKNMISLAVPPHRHQTRFHLQRCSWRVHCLLFSC